MGDGEKGGVGLLAGLPFSSDKGGDTGWGVQAAACMARKRSSQQGMPWSSRSGLWRSPLDGTVEALVLWDPDPLRQLSPRLPDYSCL